MSDPAPPNYFTCTLGQAAATKLQSSANSWTVNELIENQARLHPDLPAVAFPVPVEEEDEKWGHEVFTFKDLLQGSSEVADNLYPQDDRKATGTPGRECVALLCHSSIDFLFSWLGLMRAGFSVLLVAPQCNPEAITSLCESCGVSKLYHDKAHSELASVAAKLGSNMRPILLYWQDLDNLGISICEIARASRLVRDTDRRLEFSASDVAYIHHSSGTSTGAPKPIPQSNSGAVGVLPQLHGQDSATFTTTPLYHGGIADCFRAWKSNALIWLFPGADIPITTKTIISSLSVTKRATNNDSQPPVKYFSSVPYVLQMLAETSEGISALQSMAIVGVGGAALPRKIGDDLVAQGINLISRFGSAECGFLMSSHRNYELNKEWQFLRATQGSLCFEDQGDGSGLCELIVPPSWPHMAKRNREDGSYATSDMFVRHQTIDHAWKYHSRSDSQITLLTGKKFDPAPLEDAIKASSPIVQDALIFGDGKQMPGALIFLGSDHGLSAGDLEDRIWRIIEKANSEAVSHSKIARNMFIIKIGSYTPLERSSKGTLLRRQAEDLYATDIDDAYRLDSREMGHGTSQIESSCQDVNAESIVKAAILEILEHDLIIADDADFYQHGVDSTRATQIRSALQKRLGRSLPWNVVYDCGNVEGLIKYISEIQTGRDIVDKYQEDEGMENMVEKYSRFQIQAPAQASNEQDASKKGVVVLTGATGGLGAHILDNLRNHSSISRIICLVRADDRTHAVKRVSSSLVEREKSPLSSQEADHQVLCLPFQLQQADLGLDILTIEEIQETASHFIHAAWAVNFSLSLKSFAIEHVAGLQNLINLAMACRNLSRFVFCSSTASVMDQAGAQGILQIPEQIFTTPPSDKALGYSKSKWVAEAICAKASETTRLTGKIKVLRIGQLTGDTENGVWNRSEAWPLMLSASRTLGCLPKLDETLNWLPVDIAARAVVDISLASHSDDRCSVYHLVNNSTHTTWFNLLDWTLAAKGNKFEVVSPEEWLDRLEKLDSDPAKGLLGLWRTNLASPAQLSGEAGGREKIVFDTKNAEAESAYMRGVGPVDEDLVKKIWRWLGERD